MQGGGMVARRLQLVHNDTGYDDGGRAGRGPGPPRGNLARVRWLGLDRFTAAVRRELPAWNVVITRHVAWDPRDRRREHAAAAGRMNPVPTR